MESPLEPRERRSLSALPHKVVYAGEYTRPWVACQEARWLVGEPDGGSRFAGSICPPQIALRAPSPWSGGSPKLLRGLRGLRHREGGVAGRPYVAHHNALRHST